MEEKSEMLLKLEALKKELAVKSKKLEKSKQHATVRAYVRKKIKEHNDMDSLGIGSSERSFTAVDGNVKRCVNVDSKPGKTTSASAVMRNDVLCLQNNEHSSSSHTKSNRKAQRGCKDPPSLAVKEPQTSFQTVECDNSDKKKKNDLYENKKGSGKMSKEENLLTVSNKVTGTAVLPKLRNEGSNKCYKDKTDMTDKILDTVLETNAEYQFVNKPKGKRKNRLSLLSRADGSDNITNKAINPTNLCCGKDIPQLSPVYSGNGNDQSVSEGEGWEFHSCAKQSVGLILKSPSSVVVNTIVDEEKTKRTTRQFSQKRSNNNVDGLTFLQVPPDSTDISNQGTKHDSNAPIGDLNNKLCEESISFITPSFQNGKQHDERVLGLDRIQTNYPATRDNVMSNSDFLGVLGIPQNDYDADKTKTDFLNSISMSNEKHCDNDKFTCDKDKFTNDSNGQVDIPLFTESSNNSRVTHKSLNVKSDLMPINSLYGLHNTIQNDEANHEENGKMNETRKSLTLKSVSVNNELHNTSPSHIPTLELQTNNHATVTESLSHLTTNYPLTAELTELDVIPYSQFELTEDFLSETPCSQTDSSTNTRKRKSKGRQVGPLIKRKSPRLSSNLFPWRNPQDLSSDSQSSKYSLVGYKRSKQSLAAQKKAIAVVSVFQLLMDKAKNNSSEEDYKLPNEFWTLMEAKSKGAPIGGINQNIELERERICKANINEDLTSYGDICVIEDSEYVEGSEEMKQNIFEQSEETQIAKLGESQIVNKEIDLIEDSEMVVSVKEKIEIEKESKPAANLPKSIHDFMCHIKTTKQKPQEHEYLVSSQSQKLCKANTRQDKIEDIKSCDYGENPAITGNRNEDKLQHNKNDRALSAIGGDTDNDRAWDLSREVDDNTVIQNSYHSTPNKRVRSGKGNKMTLLQSRRSLKTPLFRGVNLLARLALNNSNTTMNEAGELMKSTNVDENMEFLPAMQPEPEDDINERASSPVGSYKNGESSPHLMNSFMSSSTPKLDRQSMSKTLSAQDALSPIINTISSPSQSKNTSGPPESLLLSPECGNIDKNTDQGRLLSLTSTPNPKEIQQFYPFSPIEKSIPPQDINTSDFHVGDSSFQIGDCDQTIKADCPDNECEKQVIRSFDSEDSVFKHAAISISDANSNSKTETRLTIGDDFDTINCPVSTRLEEGKNSTLSKNLESIFSEDKSKLCSPKPSNFLETSSGKSPFSKYLEESVMAQETNGDYDGKIHHSPTHVSPWQRIPKTSSTPLQIFETSCTAPPRLLSPIFTPSRMSRSRGKTSGSVNSRSKKTLKFDGCFQSCSEDAVVQLLHGKLYVNKTVDDDDVIGVGKWKRYLVSIQASALTVWIQNGDKQNDWSPELDWRLSATTHILHACILPITDKIAIAASGWETTHPIVTVFVYDFVKDHTLRFNIPCIGDQSNLRVSQIHLCPFPSPPSMTATSPPLQPQLLLGTSSDSHHTLLRVVFYSDLHSVAASEAFDTLYRGKLNTLLLCRGQNKACVTLTWDQRITVWNTEERTAILTVSIPSYLPCLTALVDVRVIKGLLFLTASWRVEEMGDCGGILVWNPMTGCFKKTRVWNIPNAGWRSTEKTKKEKDYIYSTSSSGSVSWWNGRNCNMVGYRQSNIATCVSGIENRHLVVGEMHGCVHLYSMY